MSRIITLRVFLQYYTYLTKLCIYAHKGTTNDQYLEQLVNTYNKYKKIEIAYEPSNKDIVQTVRCVRRLNLSLKADDNNNPLDSDDKAVRQSLMTYDCHRSIEDNKVADFLPISDNVRFLSNIPMSFLLKEGKCYQSIWQHVRFLFYASQYLLSECPDDMNVMDPIYIRNKAIQNKALSMLEYVTEQINRIEELDSIGNLMSMDRYLNARLLAEDDTDQACTAIKKIFRAKGVDNPGLTNILDTIVTKLKNVDIMDGNFMTNIIDIAKSTVSELGDGVNNIGDMKDVMGVITDIFKSSVADGSGDLPDDVKNLMDNLSNMDAANMDDEQARSTISQLENKLGSLGINYEDVVSQLHNVKLDQ